MKTERTIILLIIILIIFCIKLMFFDIDSFQRLESCSHEECKCDDLKAKGDIKLVNEVETEYYQLNAVVDEKLPVKNMQTCILNYTSSLSKTFFLYLF